MAAACRYRLEKRRTLLKHVRDGKSFLKAVEFHNTYDSSMDHLSYEHCRSGLDYLYAFIVWGDGGYLCEDYCGDRSNWYPW